MAGWLGGWLGWLVDGVRGGWLGWLVDGLAGWLVGLVGWLGWLGWQVELARAIGFDPGRREGGGDGFLLHSAWRARGDGQGGAFHLDSPRCYAIWLPLTALAGSLRSPARGLKSDDSFRDGSLPVENGGAVKSQKVTTVPHLRPKRVLCIPGREARSCKVRCDFASPPCPARPREGVFLGFAG